MSSPRVIVQILIAGSQILGRAFMEAGRQAVRNARHRPAGAGGEVAGVDKATTGSATDRLTREHRMTVDEAQLILNVKRSDEMEKVLKNYEHLFAANSMPPETEGTRTGKGSGPRSSHYLQSKVVRALQRMEAEQAASASGGQEADPPPQRPKE